MPERRDRIVFDGEQVVLIEEEMEPLEAGEIRIETEYTQVSIGTEISNIDQAVETGERLDLGYSHVGVVEAVGEDVDRGLLGQRLLSLSPHASHVTVEADSPRTVPVPEDVPPDLATLGILGSVAYHIVERANPRLLEPTAVLGQGSVGSIATQLACRAGARPVIAMDLQPDRLERAERLGAHASVDPSAGDPREAVEEITGGEGVGLCIEAANSPDAYGTAIDVLGQRGRLVVSSAVFEPVEFTINPDIVQRELTIKGAFQPACPVEETPFHPWTQQENRRAVLGDIRDDDLAVDHLLSHREPPENCTRIYERLRDRDRSIVGVAFDWREAG